MTITEIYLFSLNKKFSLDGDYSFNIAGLVNHSCEANSIYEGKGRKFGYQLQKI